MERVEGGGEKKNVENLKNCLPRTVFNKIWNMLFLFIQL